MGSRVFSVVLVLLPALLVVGVAPADGKLSAGTVAADPCNQYLAIQVGSDARFNEGAHPDPATCAAGPSSFNLSYNWPSPPGTSFTTVQVDGTNLVYGTDGTVISPPTDTGQTNQSSWQVTPGVKVSQTLSIVNGPSTGNPDTALITYDITNTDTVSHQVGLRVMIDTMLNGNDGAPFYIPGVGPVTNEMDFTGSAVPQYWQAFYSLTSSTQYSAQGTLVGNGATPPDRFVIAAWPSIDNTLFDYTVNPAQSVTSDSAVAIYWNSRTLAPGATASFSTLYGLSGFTQDLSPPLALSLTAPASLSATSGGYSPNPFTVSAFVQNVGTATATGTSLTVNLPAGLTLAAGQTASQSVGDLAPGGSAEVSWQVVAAPQSTATSLTYSVTATATNTTPKTLSRSISLPALSTASSLTLLNHSQVQPCGAHRCARARITARLLRADGSPLANQLVTLHLTPAGSPKGHAPPIQPPAPQMTGSNGEAVFRFRAPAPQAVKIQATATDPATGQTLTSNTAAVTFSPPRTSVSPIGALVWSRGGNCSGTVVRSSSGLVVVTAAHCVTDALGSGYWVFGPSYDFAHAYAPYGVWTVSNWAIDSNNFPGNEAYDYAFFVIKPDDNGRTVQRIAGGFAPDFTARPGRGFTQYAYPAVRGANGTLPGGLVVSKPKTGPANYESSPDANGAASYNFSCNNRDEFIGSSSGGPLLNRSNKLAGILQGPASSVFFQGVVGAFLSRAAIPLYDAANTAAGG